MKNKALFDKRSQSRQTQRANETAKLYRQLFSTLSLVIRAIQRWISRGVSTLVTRLKTLALPAGQSTVLSMLRKGVDNRLPRTDVKAEAA